MIVSCYYFWKDFNHTYGMQSVSGMYKFILSVHFGSLLVFSFVRLFVHLLTFRSKFCIKLFIAYISVTA